MAIARKIDNTGGDVLLHLTSEEAKHLKSLLGRIATDSFETAEWESRENNKTIYRSLRSIYPEYAPYGHILRNIN